MRMNGRLPILMLLGVLGFSLEVNADPPVVGYIYPAGGQRGTNIAARIGGCNLYDAPRLLWHGEGVYGPSTLQRTETIWFEGPVIPQPASQQREDYPKDCSAPLVLPGTASLGRHAWRLATSQGVTEAWGFVVGEFPEVVEVEEEGDSPPVNVTLPVTINGRIFPREDVDSWKFSAAAGQVVTCHVATSELGSPLDARVTVSDANGLILAETLPAGEITPPLRLTIPANGEYQLRIHDISFHGLQNHVYRLTITTGPVLDAVFPLGGRRGTQTRFQLEGVNLAQSETTFTMPATGSEAILRLPDLQTSFGDVKLELDELEELLETEIADAGGNQQPFNVPCVMNGRILLPGEEDVWPFKAVKGQECDFDVHASRCGSPLDAVIGLCDSTGKTIQETDDTAGLQADARLRWTAPEDGDYQIRIRDRLSSRGGKRFSYRIRATSVSTPDFRLKLAADLLNIEQGQSANLKVTIERGPGFKEPVELTLDGLPAGLTIGSPTIIAANQQEISITFKVEKEAGATTTPVRVTGTANILDFRITRSAVAQVPVSPPGTDSVPIADNDSPLWVSVTIPTPFKFVGAFESKFIPRGAVYVRKYRIERNGFEGPLEVRLADRQGRHLQGVTAQSVVVGSNQNDFEFAVDLPSWMEVGRTCRSTLAISGMVRDADGNSHSISFSSNDQNNQMIALVAPGRLTLQLSKSTVTARPGERIELPIRIQRSPEVAGPVTLELVCAKSITGVSASPVSIASGQDAGTLIIEFSNELHGVYLRPLTIRATAHDERQLPVMAEVKLTLVDPGSDADTLLRELK